MHLRLLDRPAHTWLEQGRQASSTDLVLEDVEVPRPSIPDWHIGKAILPATLAVNALVGVGCFYGILATGVLFPVTCVLWACFFITAFTQVFLGNRREDKAVEAHILRRGWTKVDRHFFRNDGLGKGYLTLYLDNTSINYGGSYHDREETEFFSNELKRIRPKFLYSILANVTLLPEHMCNTRRQPLARLGYNTGAWLKGDSANALTDRFDEVQVFKLSSNSSVMSERQGADDILVIKAHKLMFGTTYSHETLFKDLDYLKGWVEALNASRGALAVDTSETTTTLYVIEN